MVWMATIMLTPGTKVEYTDALGHINLGVVERFDAKTKRIYIRLERSAGLVWFEEHEHDRIRPRTL